MTRSPAPTTVSVVVALVLAWIAWTASAADAPTWREGRLGDADFIIGLPAKWNGGLVMFAHGYQGEGAGRGDVQSSPLGGQLTAGGYAWAASGYRSKGYRPDWFLADMLALRDHVIKELGQPRWTIIHGQSMGGHVAIASLELYPDVYQGGLIECGVVDGVGLVDWLRAYTAAAEYFSGVPLFETRVRRSTRSSAARGCRSWANRASTPSAAGASTASSSTSPAATSRSVSTA